MKNIKWARLIESSFLFLVIGFLMLLSPLSGKAQNNSMGNLAGTEWSTGAILIPTANTDNSVTTLTRYLVFYKRGRVEATIIRNKTAGGDYQYVNDNVCGDVYNYLTGRYEYKCEYKLVYKYASTPPKFIPQAWEGTYEVKGKSIYLSFPAFTISATVYGDSMKGLVTYKETNEKEVWILSSATSKQNNSSSVKQEEYVNGKPIEEGRFSSNDVVSDRLIGIEEGKFAAPADSPLLGTWKYIEYYDNERDKLIIRDLKNVPRRTFIANFSANGVLEITVQDNISNNTEKTNWKYISKGSSSGILEQYQGDGLLYRGNVKWINSNQFEYTNTFHQNPNMIGQTYTYTRQ